MIVASRYGIDASVTEGQKVCWRFNAEDAVLVDREVSGTVEDKP